MALDAKDKRILYELDYHVRTPISRIARQARMPKQVVNYRVNRMIEDGIIRGFKAVVDIHRLGYFGYRLYLRLHNLSPDKEKEAYRKLSRMKNLFWLVLTTGSWDMELFFLARNNVHFSSILLELKGILGEHLRDYAISPSIIANHFKRKYLVSNWSHEDVSPAFTLDPRIHEIDATDFKILKILSQDASTSYKDIGDKIGLSYNGAKKRVKALEKDGILKSYRVWLDLDKVGRKYYKALISVSRLDEKLQKAMVSFCMNEPAVEYLVICAGVWDVELEAEVKDEYEFRELLMRFRNEFSEYIGDYEVLHVYGELSMNYFPFESYEDFKHFYEVKWVGVSRP